MQRPRSAVTTATITRRVTATIERTTTRAIPTRGADPRGGWHSVVVDSRGSSCNDCRTAGSYLRRFFIPVPKSALTPRPKEGAECGSSARSDLREGQPEPITGEGAVPPAIY